MNGYAKCATLCLIGCCVVALICIEAVGFHHLPEYCPGYTIPLTVVSFLTIALIFLAASVFLCMCSCCFGGIFWVAAIIISGFVITQMVLVAHNCSQLFVRYAIAATGLWALSIILFMCIRSNNDS